MTRMKIEYRQGVECGKLASVTVWDFGRYLTRGIGAPHPGFPGPPTPSAMPAMPDRETGTARVASNAVIRRERLRFTGFSLERSPSGRVSCQVTLEFSPGESITGRAEGQASPAGDSRLGAEAAIRALELFTERAITFELVGVKVVRAFDANVVITSLLQRGDDGPDRLLGCYLADGDMVRGAALAVLNATNRILGNYIAAR